MRSDGRCASIFVTGPGNHFMFPATFTVTFNFLNILLVRAFLVSLACLRPAIAPGHTIGVGAALGRYTYSLVSLSLLVSSGGQYLFYLGGQPPFNTLHVYILLQLLTSTPCTPIKYRYQAYTCILL